MKLNKIDKITISVVGILIITAIICNVVDFFIKKNHKDYHQVLIRKYYEQKQLPKNIKELSKNYNAFTELFNSDERIFTYGYEPLSVKKNKNQKFHKELLQKIEDANVNFKVLPYPDWEKTEEKIKEENGINTSCTIEDPEHEDLDTVLDIANECFYNTCIIDAKNGKYTVIERDINYIIKVLKNNGKKIDNYKILN